MVISGFWEVGELQRKAGYRGKQLISPVGQRKGVVSKRGFPCFLILGVGVIVDLGRRCGERLCAKDLLTSSPESWVFSTHPHIFLTLCWERSDKRESRFKTWGGLPSAAHRLETSEGPVTKTSPGELTRQPLTPPPPGTFSCSEPQSKTKGCGEEGASMPSNHRGRPSSRPPAARHRVLRLAEAQGLAGQLPGPLSPGGGR